MEDTDIRVYQAGAISGTSMEEAASWRDELKQKYPNVKWIDPLAHQDFTDDETVPADIVTTDCELILNSDCLYVSRVPSIETWGTPMEVRIAYQHNIPVVVLNYGNDECSPWLRFHATTICATERDAVKQAIHHGLRRRRKESVAAVSGEATLSTES